MVSPRPRATLAAFCAVLLLFGCSPTSRTSTQAAPPHQSDAVPAIYAHPGSSADYESVRFTPFKSGPFSCSLYMVENALACYSQTKEPLLMGSAKSNLMFAASYKIELTHAKVRSEGTWCANTADSAGRPFISCWKEAFPGVTVFLEWISATGSSSPPEGVSEGTIAAAVADAASHATLSK
jgi:hypothetical protein